MFKYPRKTLINGLTTIFSCILLWNTSIWHNDVLYVHIIIYLKLQLLPATSVSCPVRDLSSPRVGNRRVGVSASCPATLWAVLNFVSLLLPPYTITGLVVSIIDKKPSYRWGTARRGRASWNLVKFCTNVDDLYLKSSETRLLPIRL